MINAYNFMLYQLSAWGYHRRCKLQQIMANEESNQRNKSIENGWALIEDNDNVKK